jgi:hypothetical protein
LSDLDEWLAPEDREDAEREEIGDEYEWISL